MSRNQSTDKPQPVENLQSAGGYGSKWVGSQSSVLDRLIWLIYPPMPTLNSIPADTLTEIKEHIFTPGGHVLNVGAGDGNGCGKRLWENLPVNDTEITNVDIGTGDNVDIVADAAALPFKDGSFDAVVTQAVLEHVENAPKVVSEICRVLKADGIVYSETPFLQGVHADPHDYNRFTLNGLEFLFADFDKIDSGVSVGPWCSFVWLVRDGLSSCFRWQPLYYVSRFALSWILAPFRYLDYLPNFGAARERLASEYYYLGRKSNVR